MSEGRDISSICFNRARVRGCGRAPSSISGAWVFLLCSHGGESELGLWIGSGAGIFNWTTAPACLQQD